jgi:L-lactate dehydrogenase complex protein LldG
VTEIENPGRERILARVRKALAVPAPRHASDAQGKQIFPPVVDPLARFQKECVGNKTECLVTADLKESASALADVLASLPAGEIFAQDTADLRAMAPAWMGRSVRWSSQGGPSESSQATISTAEALVAATGSILVSAACGGRGASVVAPVHIVLAGIDQLVPDLKTVFALQRERGTLMQNSYVCLITGSSRTADIEKILVSGAHGPRRLVVVLSLGSSTDAYVAGPGNSA